MTGTPALVTLLASDLVASTSLIERLGDDKAADLFARHDRLARDLQAAHSAQEIDKTDGFLLIFDRATSAVNFALAYHDGLAVLGAERGLVLDARVGIHVDEVILRENTAADVARGAKRVEIEGIAKPLAARVMSLAGPRQTLLSRVAFDLARRGTMKLGDEVNWLAHGAYMFKGIAEPLEVYEVGRVGRAPLTPPADTDKARRVVDPDTIVGWRPAPGVVVPGRASWVLDERVGGGGFGDVWRAEHRKTGEHRVYKFCYDARRLSGLRREVALIRLLKHELGDRKDIARIIDWNFDEAPYFIEAEWTAGGSLDQWAASQGGIGTIPLAVRVDIVARVADALAAAHSVGVLHKDVKPANILMTSGADGAAHPSLTDFGIGLITDRQRLEQAGITSVGLTEVPDADSAESSMSGTRLYMAPELLEGRPATVHADVYALGILLYQLVVGDLTRALGSGWEEDVADDLLREDIASAVVANPERRIDVRALAERLRRLDARRREREAQIAARHAADRTSRRRRWLGLAAAGLLVFAVATAFQLRRVAAEANRANREAESSRRVLGFVLELFRLADPSQTRGNSVTAREILDAGSLRIDSTLVNEPAIQATLMQTMGNAYLGLGLTASARPMAERAIAIRRKEFGERSLETAEALKLLADIEFNAGDYKGSAAHFRDAIEIRRERLGDRDPLVADALTGLANAIWRDGDYPTADSIARAGIAMSRASGAPPAQLAIALSTLGVIKFTVGKSAEAEPLFREALALTQAAHGKEDRRGAQMMMNVGMTLTAQGKFDEAEELSREALRINRKLLGPAHQVTAVIQTGLAMLLQQQKKFAEAEKLDREAVAVLDARQGAGHPMTAGTRTNLAWVLADVGRCTEAEKLTREALTVLHKTLPPGHWGIAQAESILGQCLAERGKAAEAEPLLTRSYPIIKRTQGGMWASAALERIIAFYERGGNRAKAAEYRAQRDSSR